jgi:hypothetical protein
LKPQPKLKDLRANAKFLELVGQAISISPKLLIG